MSWGSQLGMHIMFTGLLHTNSGRQGGRGLMIRGWKGGSQMTVWEGNERRGSRISGVRVVGICM